MPSFDVIDAKQCKPLATPKVSVVVPCFNGEKMLEKAIESVLSQTVWDSMELIIVDDKSTDGSLELLKQYDDNPKITVLKNEINRGISATKNHAIRAAKGELVAFLDQDDIWWKDKIEKQSSLFLDSEIGLAVCSVIYQDELGANKGKSQLPPGKYHTIKPQVIAIDHTSPELLLKYPVASASTVMVRKACFDEYGLLNEKLYSGDEIELCSRVLGRYKIVFDEQPLVFKIVHDKNASGNVEKMRNARLMLLDELVKNLPILKKYESARKADIFFVNGVECLLLGRRLDAREDFIQSIKNNKGCVRYYIAFCMTIKMADAAIKRLREFKRTIRRLSLQAQRSQQS